MTKTCFICEETYDDVKDVLTVDISSPNHSRGRAVIRKVDGERLHFCAEDDDTATHLARHAAEQFARL